MLQSIKQPFLIETKAPLKRRKRRFFFELLSLLHIVGTFRILWIIRPHLPVSYWF